MFQTPNRKKYKVIDAIYIIWSLCKCSTFSYFKYQLLLYVLFIFLDQVFVGPCHLFTFSFFENGRFPSKEWHLFLMKIDSVYRARWVLNIGAYFFINRWKRCLGTPIWGDANGGPELGTLAKNLLSNRSLIEIVKLN